MRSSTFFTPPYKNLLRLAAGLGIDPALMMRDD